MLTASALATVDVPRAAQRRGSELAIAAHRMLRSFAIVALGRDVQQRGALVGPADLSSLAATQLASELRLAQLDPVSVAYDTRMLESAAMAGLRTSSAKRNPAIGLCSSLATCGEPPASRELPTSHVPPRDRVRASSPPPTRARHADAHARVRKMLSSLTLQGTRATGSTLARSEPRGQSVRWGPLSSPAATAARCAPSPRSAC